MRIRIVSVPMTEDDFNAIYAGADIEERKSARPRQRASVIDFMRQAALEKAEELTKRKLAMAVGSR